MTEQEQQALCRRIMEGASHRIVFAGFLPTFIGKSCHIR